MEFTTCAFRKSDGSFQVKLIPKKGKMRRMYTSRTFDKQREGFDMEPEYE